MAPKYGETKKSNLQLAYMLAANGLNVLRFDHTCHIGESAGDPGAFTLSRGLGDILGCIDFLETRFGCKTSTLLASSLSARTAIRAAAVDHRITQLVCIVGVVNLQSTLSIVYGEDIVSNYLGGKRWGLTDNFFGRQADWDAFLGDLCEQQFHSRSEVEREVETIHVPVVFFSGDDDAWADIADVEAVIAKSRHGRLIRLPDTKHEVRENTAAWAKVYQDVVEVVAAEAWGVAKKPMALRMPSQRCLLGQNRTERLRLREVLARDNDEKQFWSDYLGKYVVMEHVVDFGGYLDLVCDLLSPLGSGDAVLDAGCGTGLWGIWLMRRLALLKEMETPVSYVGVDLTPSGLAAASGRHAAIQAEALRLERDLPRRTVDLFFASSDFDRCDETGAHAAIPQFADGFFSAVCCSLVLSYLERPHLLLRELKRVLRPEGRIVVSSMKPHCDVSNIYRDFVGSRATEQEVESARNLLGGVREILVKQEIGMYIFYDGEELARLVSDAGFSNVQVYSAFGDQVVAVSANA